MRSGQPKLKRPNLIIIWCLRFCFVAIIYLIGKFWLENGSPAWAGKIIFGGFIATSAIAIATSFIQSKASLAFIVVAIITMPLITFLGMDIIVLHGSWWELLIGIPMQMAIPFAAAFYMWKAPNVRNYYLPNHK